MIGRAAEIDRLDRTLAECHRHGRSLLVQGEPGAGKSELLRVARSLAERRSMPVLATRGVESETALPYAALLGLLRPVLPAVGRLPARQRAALRGALGLEAAPASTPFVIGLAVLELLADHGADHGLLVLVDDAHQLDVASRDVLAFVTRRLADEPIVCVSAARTTHPRPFDADGEDVVLGRLARGDARALLRSAWPDLSEPDAARVLAVAEGNPLALTELPGVLGPGRRWVDDRIPLTERLERAFGDRSVDLPPAGRDVLLVAAADDGGSLAETLTAAGDLLGRPASLDDLEPAVTARLVAVAGTTVVFRHPLVRSAVLQAAGPARLRRAHLALARTVADDPDRRSGHRAAAATAPDDVVADDLAAAAERARHRGAPTEALRRLQRSAALAATPSKRVARVIEALELAFELGLPDVVGELLDGLRDTVALTPHQRDRLTWIQELREDGVVLTPVVARRLVTLAAGCRDRGELELATRITQAAALRCWWTSRDPDVARSVAELAGTLTVDPQSPAVLFVRAAVRPETDGDFVRDWISARAGEPGTTPADAHMQGLAAQISGDPAVSSLLLARAADGYRRQGRLGLLAQALTSHAAAAAFRGRFDLSRGLAEEAVRLTGDLSGARWRVAATMAAAVAAACLGEDGPPMPAEAELRAVANPAQWAQLAHARALVALTAGDPAAAYGALRPVFTPGDRAYHTVYGQWVVADLVEAGLRSGHEDFVAGALAGLDRVGCPSPLLRANLAAGHAHLRAFREPGGDPYGAVLAGPDLQDFPFLRARVLLARGTLLRRRSRTAARPVLRQARDDFEALGLRPWGARARAELDAAGEPAGEAATPSWSALTAQERQIAQLAAQGLSNREIGARLYLSHRTVGSHLYRLFPKLGITRRGQLAAALARPGPVSPPGPGR